MSASIRNHILRYLPLIFILIGLGCFFYFHLYIYFDYPMLRKFHASLSVWTEQHYLLAVLSYMAIYILAVALSVPGAIVLTLAGGFLFGILFGTIYVVLSATIGATLIFLVVRTALGDWLSRKAKGWVKRMEEGFQKNAFSYLLVLRLVPLFPFWVVNIVPAILNIRLKTFFFATLVGIIPGSFVYVLVGNGLSSLFATNQTPNFSVIFQPKIFLAFIALALLSLIPVFYKKCKGNRHGKNSQT